MDKLWILPVAYAVSFSLVYGLAHFVKRRRWSCKIGWHDGDGGGHSFDGASIHGTCSKCGKEVMQDSQGNWF